MAFNSQMLILAREYREYTQDDLAKKCGISRVKIAKVESGILAPTAEEVLAFATALAMPEAFFESQEPVLTYGSSAYYYRKKADISAVDRKRVHSVVNMARLGLKAMLQQVDVESQRALKRLSLEDYGGNPEHVAAAIRVFWKLPDGPIANMTSTLEGAGVIVVVCDFGTNAIDATSLWLADAPPMIFISGDIPGDRWRFTLAHELAHLILHEIPHERMEDEADAFAAALLMPELDMKSEFSRLGQIKLRDLADMKMYWKVSIAALLKRAGDLGFLTDNQARYLWMTMSKLGYRGRNGSEPNPIPREQPSNVKKLFSLFANELQFALEDLAQLMNIPTGEIKRLFDASPWVGQVESRRHQLRLVGSGA